jgi:hypothetical protein
VVLLDEGLLGGVRLDFNGLAKRNMPGDHDARSRFRSRDPADRGLSAYYLRRDEGRLTAVGGGPASAVSLFLLPHRRGDVSSDGEGSRLQSSYALTAAVSICAVGTLAVGLAPERLLEILHNCVPGKY